MDVPKVRAELERFVHLTTVIERTYRDDFGNEESYFSPRASQDDIVVAAHVVEQILDRLLPAWRSTIAVDTAGHWQQHREAAQRALVTLERDDEVRAMLGDNAPTLSAGGFHSWAWDGARSMWSVGSYDRAVEDALARVNAETRNKVGRRDLGETKLFQLVFSTEAPKPGCPGCG